MAPDPAVMGWLLGRVDPAFSVDDKPLQDRAVMVGGEPMVAGISIFG